MKGEDVDRERYRNVNWEDLVYYDETSPSCLRWKTNVSKKCKKDSRVGTKGEHSWDFRFKGKHYKCHVVVLSLFEELQNDKFIDHINRDSFDNRITNLRQISLEENMRNRSKLKSNKTGKTGVYYTKYEQVIKCEYYAATWSDEGGKKEKRFNISTYGSDEAFRLACEYRESKIEELKSRGFGYTETHGQ